MDELRVRPMTPGEFIDYRERTITDYAADQVRAENWHPSEAEALAARDTDDLLPAGVDTPGMVLLVGEIDGDGTIGMVWLELRPTRRAGAWLYDINVVPEQRGHGYGRALLLAAEREAQKHGISSIALNVFAGNTIALELYESAGYEVTQHLMRKALKGTPAP